MSDDKRTKVTFYAEPDIKEWLDSLSPGEKSRTINELLREGRERHHADGERLSLIESRLKKLEKDNQFDGYAIAALRRVLMNRFGAVTAEEFKKEYDDLYFGAPRPPRNPG